MSCCKCKQNSFCSLSPSASTSSSAPGTRWRRPAWRSPCSGTISPLASSPSSPSCSSSSVSTGWPRTGWTLWVSLWVNLSWVGKGKRTNLYQTNSRNPREKMRSFCFFLSFSRQMERSPNISWVFHLRVLCKYLSVCFFLLFFVLISLGAKHFMKLYANICRSQVRLGCSHKMVPVPVQFYRLKLSACHRNNLKFSPQQLPGVQRVTFIYFFSFLFTLCIHTSVMNAS